MHRAIPLPQAIQHIDMDIIRLVDQQRILFARQDKAKVSAEIDSLMIRKATLVDYLRGDRQPIDIECEVVE